MDGDEVVQLYVQTPNATLPTPNIRLANFTRVFIEKSQSVSVTLAIIAQYHASVNETVGSLALFSPC